MDIRKIINEEIEKLISDGIQAVIFDFDFTLVNTRCFDPYRKYAKTHRDWSIYDKHISETIVYPGIKELISYLHKNNIKVIVVTDNKQSVAEKTLGLHGIDYDAIRGAQGWMMPKWKRMLVLLNKFGIDPKNAISVGDFPSDEIQSQKAGIRFIGANWGNKCFSSGCNSPAEIKKYIEELNN